MATGRTVQKHSKVYIRAAVEATPYAQAFGPLVWEYDDVDCTTIGDAIKGYLPGQARVTPTTYNFTADPGASTGGYWFNYSGGPGMDASYYNGRRIYTIALGIRGTPAAGDPVFCGQFIDRGLVTSNDGGLVTAALNIDGYDPRSAPVGYSIPWGILLHAYGAETAANSAVGIDQGASTAFGGYMVYHVTADGTATIKVQSASTNSDGSFGDVAGLTTGVTDFTAAANEQGIVATTAATTTINRYVRWQIVLGTATTITFVLSLIRRYGVGQ